MNRANLIFALILAAGLIAAIVGMVYQSAAEWLGLAVVTLPICHHLTKEEMDVNGVAACGTSYWLFGTTSWEATDCPYCLATRAEVLQQGTDTSWQTQSEDAGFGSYGPM